MAGVASALGSILQVNTMHSVLLYCPTKSWTPWTTSLLIVFFSQAALSIFGMISGPLLGLYLLGMLFRTSNSIVSISFYPSILFECDASRRYLTAPCLLCREGSWEWSLAWCWLCGWGLEARSTPPQLKRQTLSQSPLWAATAQWVKTSQPQLHGPVPWLWPHSPSELFMTHRGVCCHSHDMSRAKTTLAFSFSKCIQIIEMFPSFISDPQRLQFVGLLHFPSEFWMCELSQPTAQDK